jgi:creatinine amidohydrolase/Fe(II)-dependent formamide hydrolase-like protein
MLENTAREIYVKKFLEVNPFLIGDFKNLPVQKLKRYSQTELFFPKLIKKQEKAQGKVWDTANSRYAVLSSGGKDSLLSYGLLNEIKKEIHPIFVNESGRHWFTAINAYRYFKENIPNTSRVWTNSDRIFNQMLRFFPFIRQDFANVRSDEYPIRLWTVAVFLFGALPLLYKRGIGRLIIGNEFDTSIRNNFEGIRHYDGLYDQSVYFDHALTHYFLKKGWAISQFSILRPLSELLIEKVLAENYPHLQQYQTSCHATHIEEGQAKPCGRCEKCRRIVGMLSAIGADPTRCGYTAAQIVSGLRDIIKKGVHQESEGAQHMMYLLSNNRSIILSNSQKKKIKPHSEILRLRFDPVKSPFSAIPLDLRVPLYRIILKYAEGSLKRVRQKWEKFDILDDPSIHQPYAFDNTSENDISKPSERQINKNSQTNYIFGEFTWPDIEHRLKEIDIALLPVGAIEQHGPHLPLDTDAFDADYLAKQVAAGCSDPKPLVLPLVPYGVSYHHDDFKGTISISNETLAKIVYEIGISIARNGIKKLVIINGHGGNTPSLNFAAQMINRDSKIFVCLDTGNTSDVDIYDLVETPNDVHAGEFETSTSLAIRAKLVKLDKARKMVPQFSSRYLNFTSKRGVSWYAYTKKISEDGTIGDPTKASAEKGKKMWKIMISHLVTFVEDLKNMSLEEIYQRRY